MVSCASLLRRLAPGPEAHRSGGRVEATEFYVAMVDAASTSQAIPGANSFV